MKKKIIAMSIVGALAIGVLGASGVPEQPVQYTCNSASERVIFDTPSGGVEEGYYRLAVNHTYIALTHTLAPTSTDPKFFSQEVVPAFEFTADIPPMGYTEERPIGLKAYKFCFNGTKRTEVEISIPTYDTFRTSHGIPPEIVMESII